jgi:glutaconate CoA-transferase subunit B
MTTYPGPWVLKRYDVAFDFSSAVQVDRVGNVNSVCIGDHACPKVWLVGLILQPEHMTLFRREYAMIPYHECRNFMKGINFISEVSYPDHLAGLRALGLIEHGSSWVVTPRCIFVFDRQRRVIWVRSIHPGVSPDDLRAATGFDLEAVPTTPLPTAERLARLRTAVDPRFILVS